MMKQYLNKLCEEEAEKIAKRRQEQAALRDELSTCNAEILRRKELAKEQEKIIEERVIQFQQEKAVSCAVFLYKRWSVCASSFCAFLYDKDLFIYLKNLLLNRTQLVQKLK